MGCEIFLHLLTPPNSTDYCSGVSNASCWRFARCHSKLLKCGWLVVAQQVRLKLGDAGGIIEIWKGFVVFWPNNPTVDDRLTSSVTPSN